MKDEDDCPAVNPASGFPMLNCIIDVLGNVFGTDSNDMFDCGSSITDDDMFSDNISCGFDDPFDDPFNDPFDPFSSSGCGLDDEW